MRYVLTFFWVFGGGDSSIRISVYAYTFPSYSECRALGEKWLALPPQLQLPIAFTCQPGATSFEWRAAEHQ